MAAPRTHQPNRRRAGKGALAVALTTALGVGVVPLAQAPAGAISSDPSVAAIDVSVDAWTDAEVEAAIGRLRDRGLWVEGADQRLVASPAAAPGLTTAFGTSLFGGIVRAGGGVALEELLSALGYDTSHTAEALNDIRRAIEDLNQQVRALAERVEQLLEGQDRANFYASYTASGQAANRLSTALASVEGWIEVGANPSASDLSDMQTIIRASMSDLSFTAANPTTGTIPLMMRAVEPSAVSDLDGYWETIEIARDDYRAVLGQGLVTLDRMLRWDTSGTIAADLATLTPMATDTVRALYGYGVEAHGPGGVEFVQLRNSRALAARQTSIAPGDRDVWRSVPDSGRLSKAEVEPVLQGMAASYRPSLHGGQTLEAYLQERGIPTKVLYADTFHTHQWRSSDGALTRWYGYAIRVETGEISGNDYRHRTVNLARDVRAYKRTWTPWNGWRTDQSSKDAADAWARQWTNFWSAAARLNNGDWQAKTDVTNGYAVGQHSTRLTIGTPVNGAGGFMVDLDPARIEEAAFGSG